MLKARTDEETSQLMQLAVEASPNGMVMVDGEGTIVLVNGSTEKLFGYTREQLIGQSIDKLVPERFRLNHPVVREQYFQQPSSRAMGHGRELFALHKDGHEFPVEIGLNPIRAKSGVLVLAAIVDITERLRAQEMMRLAVEAAPNGMILADDQGIIVMVNSSAEALFGYHRDELIGRELGMLIPERYKKGHPALFREYFKNPVSRAMGRGRDLYARRKDGDEIVVEIGLNPINMMNSTMILASVVDITERKRQERHLQSALEEKEILLSEIHHRVKNNLQVIDSLIGMQLDSTGSEQVAEVLRDSQNRVKSMAMIHQTLYQTQNFSGVDISMVIQRLVSNLMSSYGFDAVRVNVDVDELYLPLDVSIPLGLIINELVSNACKHAFQSPDAGNEEPSVSVCCTQERGNDDIELRVADNGQGLPKPFEEMMRRSLGLRLVSALTHQLRGELTVSHRDPTEFCVRFALQP